MTGTNVGVVTAGMMAGVITGGVIAWWYGRAVWAGLLERERQLWITREAALVAEQAALRGECSTAIEDRTRAVVALESLQTDDSERRLAIQTTLATLGEGLAKSNVELLRKAYSALLAVTKAEVVFVQERFTHESKRLQDAVQQLVRPVHDSLAKLQEATVAAERANAHADGMLKAQLREMVDGHLRLQATTSTLVQALRAPQVRGAWAEMQLRRLVESAGMIRHVHFEEQPTLVHDDGKSRPDMIVTLPSGKTVVVDSKAPLTSFLAAMDATSESEQRAAFADHAALVRGHATTLASRGYAAKSGSADFVLMYMPADALLSAALESDPLLFDHCFSLGVFIVTPMTFLLALRLVDVAWREERLSVDARSILEAGADCYGRLSTSAEHLQKLRRGLITTVTAHDDLVASLERRALPSMRKLKDMGVNYGREIEELNAIGRTPRAITAPELADSDDPGNERIDRAA